MYLSDFTKKGFMVTKRDERKSEDKIIYRRVLTNEPEYIEIMKWYTPDKDWSEISNYVKTNYNCGLASICTDSHGTRLYLNKYAPGERIIIEQEGVKLFIDKDRDSDLIFKIDMSISYPSGGFGSESFYILDNSNDDTSVNYVLGLILKRKYELLKEADKLLEKKIEELKSENEYFKDTYSKGIGFLIDCVRIS